jgi:uncharacterized repeat protein (TIGR03803 family)
MRSAVDFFMKSVRVIAMCVLLAGQIALAQTDDASAAQSPRPAVDARRIAHTRRRFAPDQSWQTSPEQVLYTFQGGSDGYYPTGNLIFDSAGNLYGVTQLGGTGICDDNDGCGTVYELSPNGSGGWTKTTLYSFQGYPDGNQPTSGLIFDTAGNLYGTTLGGGSDRCGTAFELSPNNSGGWAETILFNFGCGPTLGPEGLVFDKVGNLYGVSQGGDGYCDYCTAVFELTPASGGGWTETTLYTFGGGSGGGSPGPGLVFDGSGNLYGATLVGGACAGCGIIFELSPAGGGGWTETTLYEFQPTNDGNQPNGGLIFDATGNIYGTTVTGGPDEGFCINGQTPYSCGTVFKLTPNGGGKWTESIPFSFPLGGAQGYYPMFGLTPDQSGNLYGTTELGGTTGEGSGGTGVVFELSPAANGTFTETELYVFQAYGYGTNLNSGLIFDRARNLYGVADNPLPGIVYEVSVGPLVGVSPTTSNFGNQDVGVAGAAQNVTLTNTGNQTLTVSAIQITGANSSEFSQQNNCPATLAQYASCTIAVVFTPTTTGPQNALISVVDNAQGSPQTVPLTGTGVFPAGSIFPPSTNFGSQTAGASTAPTALTLTNTSLGVLTISSIGIGGPNSNQFSQTNDCPPSLQPGAFCYISVTFSPNFVGNASASLNVADNAPGSPQSAALTGTGVNGIAFSPPTVTFPSQYVGTAGLPQAVTLTNNGDTTITITGVAASPSDYAPLSSCGNSLQPGAACSIGVFFDPTASGTRSGVLTITDSAFSGPQTVPLTGTGEDFSMNPGSSPSASVTPGETAKYTVEVAPSGGFSQSVTLTCAGAPLDASCSVSPSSVQLNGSRPTPVTISVSTAGSSAGITYPADSSQRSMLAMWLRFAGLPGIVLLGIRSKKKNSHIVCAIVLCLMAAIMIWTACGGSGTGSGSTTATPPAGSSTPSGSYNLTVVGTFSQGSANLVHSTKLTLVVK